MVAGINRKTYDSRPMPRPRTGPSLRRWTSGADSRGPAGSSARVIDGTVTAALLVLFATQLQTHVLQQGQRPSTWFTYVLAVGMVLPLLTHRRAPLLSAGVALSALVVYSLRHYGPYPGISIFVLVFATALHAERRRAIPVFLAAQLALTVAVWVQPGGVATTSTWVSTLLLAVVAGLVGENLRHRRARWAALEERAQFLETRTGGTGAAGGHRGAAPHRARAA